MKIKIAGPQLGEIERGRQEDQDEKRQRRADQIQQRAREQQIEDCDLPVIEQGPVGFDCRRGAVDDLAEHQEGV